MLEVFSDPARIDVCDERRPYGEERWIVQRLIQGRLYVVVYTLRGAGTRIISARKANR